MRMSSEESYDIGYQTGYEDGYSKALTEALDNLSDLLYNGDTCIDVFDTDEFEIPSFPDDAMYKCDCGQLFQCKKKEKEEEVMCPTCMQRGTSKER